MGSAPWAVTLGKGRDFDVPSRVRFRGGKSCPLGHQEGVGRDTQRGVVVEPAPTSTFEMPEPDLLFQIQIISLDPPAHFRHMDEMRECHRGIQRRQPEFRRRLFVLWPLDQQPFLGDFRRFDIALMGGAHTDAGEPSRQARIGAVTPADRLPDACWQ